ncbi:MAG TPA: hypothetical protein VGC90_06790 [Candidatus Limnocylindrales bacterium]
MTARARQWAAFIVLIGVALVVMALAITSAAGLLVQGCCTR